MAATHPTGREPFFEKRTVLSIIVLDKHKVGIEEE